MSDTAEPVSVAEAEPAPLRLEKPVAFSIHVCAFVLGAGALYLGRDVALPVLLAFLIALTLMPMVRWLSRRGVPSGLTAGVTVLALAATLMGGVYTLSGPISHWVDEAPTMGSQIRYKLQTLRGSVKALEDVEEQVSSIGDDDTADASEPQEVVVREPGFLASATSSVWSAITTLGLTLILLLFLLASGDMIYEKIIRVLPTMRDKKAALRIVYDIESSISRYLLTVTLVNIGLGIAIGTAMALLGMPNPPLWGVAAMLLNFLPYVGAIVGVTLVTLVALVTFDLVQYALVIPLTYFALTALEGNVVTPIIVGRRLELNTVAIFIGVVFWGWVWGLAGVLIAVPFLVVIKRICDHLPTWSRIGEFLAAPQSARTSNGEHSD
ncbi:MAG TPA: AI-2E family transporter [Methylomirabilota bacterium]|nr:AI-2E family transporter [Methylomirabilota bacterium]